MYLLNKYTKWYYSILTNQRARDGYTESHHIIPKSLGGSNETTNLVSLTAREHFICHWLLTKMTVGESKSKMILALNKMRQSSKRQTRYLTPITSRVFESIRIEVAKIISATNKGKTLSIEHRQAISNGLRGKSMSEEHKQKLRKPKSKSSKHSKERSAEHRAKISSANKGRTLSEEHKKRLLDSLKDRVVSEETKQKKSLALKGKPWSDARRAAQTRKKSKDQ